MSNNRSKHAERKSSAPSTTYDDAPMETDDVSSGGTEVALSIEETNKLRIALGLKPLNVEDKGAKDKEDQKKKEDLEKEQKTLEIQSRIEKAKKDREKNYKIAGKSLGEELEEEEDDAVSWVLKSRKLEEERKLAEKRSKALEEMDKAASDDEGPRRPSKSSSSATAKGLKVAHGIEDILDANADNIILTLKDAPILDKYELKEDDDELENLQLVEKEKLKLFESRKKNKPLYDVYDEEKKSILPQYDDDRETKHKKSFTIDDSTINVYQKRLEQEAEKVMEGRKFVQYSLDMDKTFASEYMTQEEAAVKFKKAKKKTVKKKTLRQKAEDETEDVNNNASTDNNIIIQDSMDIAPQDTGRGSRSESVKLARDAQKAQLDAERRQKNYELAKQKAAEETKSLVSGRPEDEEDKALLKSLSKAREMAKPERKADPLADLVARVQANKQKKDIEMASATEDPNLVFTATTEFIKNIQPDEVSKPKKKDLIKDSELEKEISEDISAHEEMLKAQQAKERKLKKEQEQQDAEMREAEERRAQEEEEEEESEEEGLPTDEPDVGSSVTAALQFLKSRVVGVEELETFVGRRTDKKVEFNESDPAPDINLSYLDEHGRPLTQKEAFRRLSWKFHGKKPGKNKQAKRMRQMEQEMAKSKMSSTDTPLNTVAKLQAEQERTQQPFVILSGKPLGSDTSHHDVPKPVKTQEKSEGTPAPKRPITTVAPTGGVKQGDFKEFKLNAPNKKPKT
mmetsp:Transcript_18123/g.25359  ORF Transcript_18123/g.25359 Transcript_18123/m.25359 type:complete len:741 (-) Transcript_18123:40-2262(-)